MKSRKLNILQLVNVRWFNASADYGVTVSYYLSKRGHNVIIIGKEGSPPIKRARELGLNVNTQLHFKPFSFFRDLKILKEICLYHDIDIINAHRAEGHALAIALRQFSNSPKIIRTRVDIRSPKKNFFNRYIHNNTDLILVPGELIKKKIIESTGISDNKVKVLYGGVDVEKFKRIDGQASLRDRLGIDKDALLIGVVARLDPIKGHLFLIQVAKKLCSMLPDIKFVVVGKDAEYSFDFLNQVSKKNGIEKKIIYAGFVEDVVSAINSFDVCVLPSLGSEAHPRVLLEYMACEKPVVSADVGIVGEILEDGISGFIVPPGDIDLFVKKIKLLIEDKNLRNQLGRNARKRILERFTLNDFINQTENSYLSVLDY